MINEAIAKLVVYALRTGLIEESEVVWASNTILDVLKLSDYSAPRTGVGRNRSSLCS